MRFIKTSNSFVEFIEADGNGNIITSRGFQLGSVYFQIKNGRVTFYLNDSDNPYTNDVWTTNIPLVIDDVEYSTPEAVTDALGAIMNSNLQDQIDELSEDLAAESARAEASETALDDAIDDERDRATSAETHLQTEITELSGTVATFDERIESVEDGVSAVTTSLNAEVTRATAKDAAHDAEISGLTTSLQNEITRATGAENSLRNDLNAEVSARTTADAAQLQRITALEVGKADKSEVYTKTESDTLLAQKADKANAVATAEYVSQNKTINFKNISGTVLSTIDATPFVVDGMVDDVRISGGSLVIVFNTDAGKQNISIPLTDIFNPANYYDKTATDALLATKLNTSDFNTYSGVTKTAIDSKLNTSDFNTYSAATENVLENVYLKSETSGATEIATALAEKLAVNDFNTYSGAVDTLINSKASQSDLDALNDVVSSHVSNADVHVTTIDKQVWNSKQNALTAGSGISIQNDVISITGGPDTFVETTPIYSSYKNGFEDTSSDIEKRVRYAILNYSGDKSTTSSLYTYIRLQSLDYNTYYPNVDLNYTNGTYTKYNDPDNMLNVEYDSEIEDYKLSVSDNYPNIYFASISISNGSVLVLETTIESGETTDVIEGSIADIFGDLYTKNLNNVNRIYLETYDNQIGITYYTNKTRESTTNIKLDELVISSNTLSPDIKITTDEINWQQVDFVNNCETKSIPSKKFRINGDSSFMKPWYFWIFMETSDNNLHQQNISWNNEYQRWDYPTGFALDWDSTNGVLTIEAPEKWQGYDYTIKKLTSSSCSFTSAITSVEYYGYVKVPLKTYVKNTRNDVDTLSGTVATKQNQLTAGTGISIQNDVISVTAQSPTVDAYTKAESDAKFATITNFNSHTGDSTAHVTASEKQTWNNKSDFSGSYNDLTNKPTIPSKTSDLTNDSNFATTGDVQTAVSGKQDVSGMTAYTQNSTFNAYTAATNSALANKQNQLTPGTGISIQNDVISVTASSPSVDAYTKAESDGKFATITNFNSHSGDTTSHVTSSEKQTWNNKPNVWSGSEQQWAAISGGTLDNNTIYLIY